jgi:hypothetical protein
MKEKIKVVLNEELILNIDIIVLLAILFPR